MTPAELRALAEALLPMAAAPCFDGIDIERAADYLRAQADAQPVAWMYEHDGCVDTPLFTVNRWTKCEEPWNESPLFLHPAPAAPQAEPCIGNNPTCPCQDGDACHYRDAADGTKGWPVPQAEPKPTPASGDDLNVYREMADGYRNDAQAEPKREPTCLWSRADDDTDVWETSCGHAFTIIEGTPSDNHMEFCCYCGRRVDEEIGGSDE